jgi:tetratricopeptide (TPR) repeat protein
MTENKEKFPASLESARNHFEKKEFKNAKLMYFQALNYASDRETRAIIWAEISWVYYYEKDFPKAIEAAENVLLQDNDYKVPEDIYRVQGYSYLSLGNQSLAERYLQLSLEKNSTEEKQQYVKYELGKLYFAQGQYDLAYPYFKEILKFFQEVNSEYSLSILFYLGFINYYLNNLVKSREYFMQILSDTTSPQREASAKFGLAFLEFREKNYLNVISLCEEILVKDEDFFDKESVGFLTAASYYYLGRKDIFRAYYSQMKDTYPKGRYCAELDNLNASAV